MADEEIEQEQTDLAIPQIWQFVKPPAPETGDDEEAPRSKASSGALVGKLIKFLNDIEDGEEFEAELQKKDPATGQSLLMWATLTGKFVLVEWLIKKAKRGAFAFHNNDKELTIYEKWVEVRKELEEKEKQKLLNPPEAEEAAEDEEEPAPEPTADQLVYEGVSDLHEELGVRGPGLVKRVGELGIYQGARNEEGAKVGLGQSLYPNGDMYIGEYVDNKRQGTGSYYFADQGILYIGKWRDNLRDGIGRIVYPDGGRYYGNFAKDKKHGEGRYTYPDGSSYSGEWRNDVKEGRGAYTFPDGSQHIGTFAGGEFCSGEWRLAGTTRYYGSFNNGNPVGRGVFVLKYGKEGSFRQEGSFEKGSWVPGKILAADAPPQLDIVIRNQTITLRFTEESAGLTIDALVEAATFAPFLEWQRAIEKQDDVFVQHVAISSIRRANTKGKQILELRAKVVAVDGEGKRIRGTDTIVFKYSDARLLVVLTDGEKSVAILHRSPNSTLMANEQLRLPTVSMLANGEFSGRFVDLVQPALRVTLRKEHTFPIPGLQGIHCNGAASNYQTSVLLYIQHVDADGMSKIQQHLDEACEGFGPLYQLRSVRLAEVGTSSTDALTVVTANVVAALMKADKLPKATVERQRPATPIPPAPEPRPDIEPLLEAERKAKVVIIAEPEE